MKQSDIQVGKTYRNKGKGNIRRTVLGIGPERDKVRFFQHGWMRGEGRLYLSSFAKWAGSVVEDE